MSRLSQLSTSFALVVSAAALTAGPALARDNDRMPDRWEKRHHLNVKIDDSRRDRDRDGLTNYGEYRAKTNPRKKDSDRDGRRDSREDYDRDRLRNAAEIKTGYDPRDKDSDNDGVRDGRENAGKIVKLSDSSVTIRLAVGGALTARRGDARVVKCEPAPGSGSGTGTGSEPTDDTPQPGEDAPEPGEDDDPGDGDLPEPGDDESGDAPDASATQEGGEDDEPFDDAAFDQEFGESFDDAAECGSTTLKVGAVVHKAQVSRTASGKTLVSVALLGTRR